MLIDLHFAGWTTRTQSLDESDLVPAVPIHGRERVEATSTPIRTSILHVGKSPEVPLAQDERPVESL